MSVDQEGVLENTFRLSCGHEFHEVRMNQTIVWHLVICKLSVLYPGLVYCGQEADLSLLSREGGPEENVPQPLGEAPDDVRPAVGLGPMVGVLAARHPGPRPGHQLGPRTGVTVQGGCLQRILPSPLSLAPAKLNSPTVSVSDSLQPEL